MRTFNSSFVNELVIIMIIDLVFNQLSASESLDMTAIGADLTAILGDA